MFTDERFDFSKESDLKDRLWEKMEQQMKQAGPVRREMSLESISPVSSQKKAYHPNDIKPNDAAKKSPKKTRG